MTSNPAYSPCDPALGCKETAAKPAIPREPILQLPKERLVTLRLRDGREGMNPPKFRPGDGIHLGGGVELHRARAERDHGCGQREVARFEPMNVTQHFRLGMVAIEHRRCQKRSRARVRSRKTGRESARVFLPVKRSEEHT